VNWNFAGDDWHCPSAENEAKSGGKFKWRMEAKDGSMGFDFEGIYDEVKEKELITYKMSDGRAVHISFSVLGDEIKLSESFEPEGTNSDEMQRTGWQAILNNFKKYVESTK
jgi:uncharacterized protein YndB with AHSA1/START domain